MDRDCHRFPVVLTKLFLFVVAVPQEDAVIHRDGELQDCRQRFGDVGYLAEEEVGAEIQEYHHSDGSKEHERHQPVIEQQKHGKERQQYRDTDVDRFFLFAQVFQIRDQCRQTAYKAFLARDRAYLADRVHRFIGRGRGIEEHRHDGAVVGVEGVIHLFGQKFLRDRDIGERVVPQHAVDLLHLFDLRFQLGDVLIGHILEDDKRESALAELVEQDVLSLDGIHAVGQVGQHIVVDARVHHAEHGGDHQDEREDQDRDAQLDDRFGKLHDFTFDLSFLLIQNTLLCTVLPFTLICTCTKIGQITNDAQKKQRDAAPDPDFEKLYDKAFLFNSYYSHKKRTAAFPTVLPVFLI